MQKEVREQRTDGSTNALGNFEFEVELSYERGERPHKKRRHKG